MIQQIVQPIWRDVSDDVVSSPIPGFVEWDIEAVLRRECVCVANDLVAVPAPGGRADVNSPMQG